MISNGECWKPIPDFPGYEVSNHGRVRSYRARGGNENGSSWHISDRPQRILSQSEDNAGYLGVALCKNGKGYYSKIAQLVMNAFVGPPPYGLEICHNDGNRKNNHLSNLRYDTHSANIIDCILAGKKAKLTSEEVIEIRRRRATGDTYTEIAEDFPVVTNTIRDVCNRYTYQHIGGPIAHGIDSRRKLSDADIQSIKQRLLDDQVKQATVAREYGVSESLISRIKSGERRA